MPIVVSQKQRIHYQIEGDHGPFVVLHGPFLESLRSWHRLGYVDALQENYRVILLDPLGQGKSDAPLERDYYTIDSRAQHVLDVLDEMGVDRCHYLGFGLGAQVGFALAVQVPQRIRSLTVAGGHPYPLTSEVQRLQRWQIELRQAGLEPYLERLKAQNELSEERTYELQRLNPEACALALTAMTAWAGVGPSLISVLTYALLITVTNEERFLAMREAGRAMPHGRYLILPELTYQEGFPKAEFILTPFIEFTKKQRWSPPGH